MMLALKVIAWPYDTVPVIFRNSSLVVLTPQGIEVLYKQQHFKVQLKEFRTLTSEGRDVLKAQVQEIIDCAYYLEYGVFPSTLSGCSDMGRTQDRDIGLNGLLMFVLDNVLLELGLGESDVLENCSAFRSLLTGNDISPLFLVGAIAEELRAKAEADLLLEEQRQTMSVNKKVHAMADDRQIPVKIPEPTLSERLLKFMQPIQYP